LQGYRNHSAWTLSAIRSYGKEITEILLVWKLINFFSFQN
jgi:hypothetical protein